MALSLLRDTRVSTNIRAAQLALTDSKAGQGIWLRAEPERATWSKQGNGYPEQGRAKQNQARQGRWDQAPQGRAGPGQAGQGRALTKQRSEEEGNEHVAADHTCCDASPPSLSNTRGRLNEGCDGGSAHESPHNAGNAIHRKCKCHAWKPSPLTGVCLPHGEQCPGGIQEVHIQEGNQCNPQRAGSKTTEVQGCPGVEDLGLGNHLLEVAHAVLSTCKVESGIIAINLHEKVYFLHRDNNVYDPVLSACKAVDW